jgi:hypothetical protein
MKLQANTKPKVGKRRLKGAGKTLILFAVWPLFGMNQ